MNTGTLVVSHHDIVGNKDEEATLSSFFEHFDSMPFHQYLGLKVHAAEKDQLQLRLLRNEETPTGIGGSVNGGVLATMLDMAAVAAVFTDIPDGVLPAGTADLQITYLRQGFGTLFGCSGRGGQARTSTMHYPSNHFEPKRAFSAAWGECCTHFGLPRPNRLFRAGCPLGKNEDPDNLVMWLFVTRTDFRI